MPVCNLIAPAIKFKNVDLPEPELPVIKIFSPTCAFRLGNLNDAKIAIQGIPEKESSLSDYKKLMLERISELEKIGLPDDWDGIYRAASK